MTRGTACDAAWSEALGRCERRDPVGHAIHFAIALLYMAVLPIGTAPAVLMSGPLLLITVLRWRFVAPLLPGVLRWAPVPLAIALVAWLALSLLWSADTDRGTSLLLSMRVLILPFCLAPLLSRRAWLAGALLAGIVLQALVQCVEYAIDRVAWNFDGMARFGGFTSDPGKAGLWDAIGVCAGAALAITLARRHAWLGVVIALVTMFGTVASGTRRQLAALAISIPVMLAWSLAVIPQRRRRVVMLIAVSAVALAAAWPLVGPSIMVRWRQTTEQMRRDSTPPSDTVLAPINGVVHYDLRAYYWKAAMDGFREHPLRGLGIGGASKAIADSSLRSQMEPWLRQELKKGYPEHNEEQIERDMHSRLGSSHPHSTWLQLLAEGGIIGFGLGATAWLLAWVSVLRRSLAGRASDPVALACTGALLLWAIGAIFDASINSTSLGAVVVLAVLGGLGQSASGGQEGR